MPVEIGLLGEVVARVDGLAVDLGPARQRCVLAALAADAGRLVPADRLVGQVWGPDATGRCKATLRTYISRLRGAFDGALAIVNRSDGYLLAVDETDQAVDLLRFRYLRDRARDIDDDTSKAQALTEALALWRGEPLAGLSGQWVDSERDRWQHERWAAEHDLLDTWLHSGQGEELVVRLSNRAGQHPLNERVAGQYMLALHRAGRTADALAHYRELRERLVEELGADPGVALRELHQQILAADPRLITAPAPAVAEPVVVPQQLPAPPPRFVGRHEELDQLAATMSTVVISAIAGAGGIGKTWLALHWAHQHIDRFPDGQLFVDLRGFTPDNAPMDPNVAVRGFLDALGVDAHRVPVEPHAQAALFRSLIAGKRMLLVLDNAADADQVAPLLPGTASCTVLVTSRRRLTSLIARHGAHHVSVGVLTDSEAHQLLIARLGAERVAAEPHAVAELLACCAGHPLALSIITGRASTAPNLPLAQLATDLRDTATRLETLDDDDQAASLPSVLSWSLRGLTAEQRTVFGLLGIAPGRDIALPAAASLTGLSPARTRKALRALEEASLIDQRSPGRYTMHDLIRAFAAHELPDHTSAEALQRILDFYAHSAYTAERILHPICCLPVHLGPPAAGTELPAVPDVPAATSWFDAEYPNLFAAQRIAARHQRHTTVWQLAVSLHSYQNWRGLHQDQLASWRASVEATAHLPDPAPLVNSRRMLGGAYAGIGHHDEALEYLREALAVAEHQRDPSLEAHAHGALSWAWGQQGDHTQALFHATQSLRLFQRLNRPVWEAIALGSAGWYSALLGDYDTARTHCQAALDLNRRYDHNVESEAATVDSLGYIDHHTGDHQGAVEHYRRALALHRQVGNTFQIARILTTLGHLHTALGQHGHAHAVWTEALPLLRQQGRDNDAREVRQQLAALPERPDLCGS